MNLPRSIPGGTIIPLCARYAVDGQEFDRRAMSVSLFAGVGQLKMTKDNQLIDLYKQERPALLNYLCGLGLNLNDAEDLVHESFIKLLDHLESEKKSENLRAWLFRVNHNLAMDLFRESGRIAYSENGGSNSLDTILDSSSSPEEDAIRHEEIRRVWSALGRLTQQQRAAVLLRAEELRYREIGLVLGVSTGRASELIRRALARLAGEQ
jgi:RNA polymerase sigma-70 factor (ECF subfamily)